MTTITIEQAMQIARGHHQAGRLVEAERIYRQVLDRWPDHTEALYLLGVAAHAAGRRDEAIAAYRRVIALAPADAAPHLKLGIALQEMGRRDEAIAVYRRILERQPDLAEAHNNLGRTLCEQGRLDEAIAALSRAVELAPGSAQAHNNLGVALQTAGRRGEAIAAYRRAIALQGDYASAYSNLGAALHSLGRRDEALALYQRALALQPDDAGTRKKLALAMQETDRPDHALAAYRRALDKDPRLAEAYKDLGNSPGEKSPPKSVLIVSATRLDADSFASRTPLGLSLDRLAFDTRLTSSVAFLNRRGLPAVFNAQINEQNRAKILVFIHDDVWIDDHFLVDRLHDAADRFDVVGVAGNTRRLVRQPAWGAVDAQLEWDDRLHLSGAVAHGDSPAGTVVFFGPAPRACRLLDGVFLAAPCDALLDAGVFFDDRFTFHFYDMDFCRTAEARGLRLGSWPIAITHVSGGGCDTPSWQAARDGYFEKWVE